MSASVWPESIEMDVLDAGLRARLYHVWISLPGWARAVAAGYVSIVTDWAHYGLPGDWGCCYPDGDGGCVISLNRNLSRRETEFVDYTIAHEFAHAIRLHPMKPDVPRAEREWEADVIARAWLKR